jgi:hypothetical protein
VAISLGLIAWLASRISLSGLAQAAAVLPWKLLVPMTAALVVGLYLWDTLCLLTVFSVGGSSISYGAMLRARGKSYLWAAWNQGLGQAAVAWYVARARRTSFRAAFAGSIILSWHEGVILSATGLAGSWWLGDPRLERAQTFCLILLLGLLAIPLIMRLLPASVRQWLEKRPMGATLAAWDAHRSLRLILLRVVYFSLDGIYVPAALWLCGQPIGVGTALAIVPLVLLATVLPSASGLGARETALYLLIPSSHPDVLVAMGVLWSTGIIIVRLVIGMGWLWFDRSDAGRETSTSSTGVHAAGSSPPNNAQLDQLSLSQGAIDS